MCIFVTESTIGRFCPFFYLTIRFVVGKFAVCVAPLIGRPISAPGDCVAQRLYVNLHIWLLVVLVYMDSVRAFVHGLLRAIDVVMPAC